MSLADLIFPRLTRRRARTLRLTQPGEPFVGAVPRTRWSLRVDAEGMAAAVGDRLEPWQELGRRGLVPVLAPAAAVVVARTPLHRLPGSDAAEWLVELEAHAEGPKAERLEALGDAADREALLERFDRLALSTYGPGARPLSSILGGDQPPSAVVVTAVDREPLLVSEGQLLRERRRDLAPALALLSRAAGGAKVLLAAPRAQAKGLAEDLDVEVLAVGDRYPEGLDELVARRAVGADGGPVAALSLESALAALAAARDGRPTLERHLTVVAADGIHRTNLRLALGTKIHEVVAQAGFVVEAGDRLLTGGPMRGHPTDLELGSVEVTTTAVVIIAGQDIRRWANDPCIGCGLCIEVCPMQLQPQEIGRNAEFGLHGRNRALEVTSCIGCGLCAHHCPSGRPLTQWIELTLAELAALDRRERAGDEPAQ